MSSLTPGRPRRTPASRLRRAIALTIAVVASLAGITLGSLEHSSAGANHQVVFGAYVRPAAGQSRQQAVQAFEAQLGRTLGVSREFLLWDEAFPSAYHRWLGAGGRTLIVSAKAKRSNGTNVPWRSIADAAPGSTVYNEVVDWVDRLGAFGAPVYFALSHEPEAATNVALGTDADFVAAWRRVVAMARRRNVTNVRFIWIMTDYAFALPSSDRRAADKWYPGDTWVDAAGIDPYNWSACRPESPNSWRSLATLIEPFRLWSLSHPDVELWLTEFASVEDPADPGRKAGWLDAARQLFASPTYSRFAGVSYYHAQHPTGRYPVCTWWMNTSPRSLDASVTLANDPAFADTVGAAAPGVTAPATTATAPDRAALLVVGTGHPLADGRAAPGCRAGLPMRHDSLSTATAMLWSVFDAATEWAAAC